MGMLEETFDENEYFDEWYDESTWHDDFWVGAYDFDWNDEAWQDFQDWNWSDEMTWNQSETLNNATEAEASTLQPTATQNTGTVGAVTLTAPPGLRKTTFVEQHPKATSKPLPKASTGTLASKALVAALVASTFAFGESCCATMATLEIDAHGHFENAFHVDRTNFETLPENVFHFNDTLLAEHLIAPVVSSGNFVLFDSGAAANVCPKNFASEWPLLPLTEPPPPLKAISSDFLKILGRRLVGMTFGNVDMFIHFYVRESISYAIVSVARLLKQGYHVEMGPHHKTLRTPNNHLIPIEQHGSLLYLNAEIKKYDRHDFENILSDFRTHFDRRLLHQSIIAAAGKEGSKPMVYYHADRWNFVPDSSTLTRLHVRPRKTLFTPDKIKDMPYTSRRTCSREVHLCHFQRQRNQGPQGQLADRQRTQCRSW